MDEVELNEASDNQPDEVEENIRENSLNHDEETDKYEEGVAVMPKMLL